MSADAIAFLIITTSDAIAFLISEKLLRSYTTKADAMN